MPEIPGWLQRLVQEEVILKQKIDTLWKFIRTGKDIGMSKKHRLLLRDQVVTMMDYHAILVKRIELSREEQHLA